jgi:class 3 adenylate cyclase/DNA-binding transcriptional MerR regulator
MKLSSIEVIERTGISRATLNNYINLGLLPRPEVASPEANAGTNARQIGYFPEDTILRIVRIKALKKQGLSMTNIALQLNATPRTNLAEGPKNEGANMSQALPVNASAVVEEVAQDASPPAKTPETGPLRLTIDRVPYPAYMVNYNMELTWYNEEARTELLGSFEKLSADIQDRKVLDHLAGGNYGSRSENRAALNELHSQMGKHRVANVLGNAALGVTGTLAGVSATPPGPLVELPLSLYGEDDTQENYRIYVSYFREGIFVVYTRDETGTNSLLGLLERRDEVIRNLLKKRLPVLTEVAVMVADLQNSVRICSELPPEEYFELINQIWSTMEPIFRRYYSTHGKHVGDGMVYYFFPQPDCSYILNALRCASEMHEAMRKISKEWQLRKNWLNELYLNTGLNEGQEWLGVFHVETKVEFTVLGDTINHAARLSDFASSGSIWASKNFIGKLTTEERNQVRFGVKRHNQEGREVFVASSYSRVSELVELDSPRYEKLRDIGGMAITEVVEVAPK